MYDDKHISKLLCLFHMFLMLFVNVATGDITSVIIKLLNIEKDMPER